MGPPKIKTQVKPEKPESPKIFREPEGMMNVDLNCGENNIPDLKKRQILDPPNKRLKSPCSKIWGYIVCLMAIACLSILIALIINKEYRNIYGPPPLEQKLVSMDQASTTKKPLKVIGKTVDKFVSALQGHDGFFKKSKKTLEIKLNMEAAPTTVSTTTSSTFKDTLKSSNVFDDFSVKLSLCKISQSLKDCCDIFSGTELVNILELCTVADVLDVLIENEEKERRKRQVPDYDYPIYGESPFPDVEQQMRSNAYDQNFEGMEHYPHHFYDNVDIRGGGEMVGGYPVQDIQYDVPRQDVQHQGIPHQDVPHQDIPHQDIPHQDVPHQDIPHQDVPHPNIPHQNVQHHIPTDLPQYIPQDLIENQVFVNKQPSTTIKNNLNTTPYTLHENQQQTNTQHQGSSDQSKGEKLIKETVESKQNEVATTTLPPKDVKSAEIETERTTNGHFIETTTVESLRANSDNMDFRSKGKLEGYPSASEDVQSNQQAVINPCFYPYMPQYSNTFRTPYGYDPSQMLKVVPVNNLRPQTTIQQPMIIMNPPMYSYVPPQSPYMQSYTPQLINNQVAASNVQAAAPNGQYYMCQPINAATNSAPNVASIPGVEVRNADELAPNFQDLMENVGQEIKTRNSSRAAIECPLGERSCDDESKCIKEHQFCDNEVNCNDGSDEIMCSCRQRIGALRLCDGYLDCPNGEDEVGCFGCKENEFSCDDWSRYRRSTCIPLVQRCDNIRQCEVTGKDEEDCSILIDKIGTNTQYKISNAVGFLHRNYRGKWYPSCFGTDVWAIDVCDIEAGPSTINPKTHMMVAPNSYPGQYVNIMPSNHISLISNCLGDRAAFVECPPLYCGLRMMVKNPYREEEVDTAAEDLLDKFERDNKVGMGLNLTKEEEVKEEKLGETEGRVVGGKASQPGAWPWLVSIFKNGVFHCGGVIINELWIVTAAHCVDRYWQYYYEIQAGMLRRFSFSPMEQSRWAAVAIPHENYDRSTLADDIALMKLSSPVRYNRYVRPICLPSETTAGRDFLQGPPPGTICTAVGWGAMVEHGADPDHMREVEVPVLNHCRHREDQNADEICAGLIEGGKDACQGDSGGPFMCRNPNNPSQWYLAGIVSHGEGCARPNEPGVYTKVSKYIAWIAENTREDKFMSRFPLQTCPGYTCKAIKTCLPKKRRCDRVVDCLLGDDEVDCENHFHDIFKHSHHRFNDYFLRAPSDLRNITDDEDKTNQTTLNVDVRLQDLNVTDEDLKKFNYSLSNNTFTPMLVVDYNNFPIYPDNESDVQPMYEEDFSEENEDKGLVDTLIHDVLPDVFDQIDKLNRNHSRELFSIIGDGTLRTEEIKEDSVNKTKSSNEDIYFRCKKMLQLIPKKKYCDKVRDCEDGSDEDDCLCADYVRNKNEGAICDGVTDCRDLSDEELCMNCTKNEFYCRYSRQCIPLIKNCDGVRDCPNNEDERDCEVLTNGFTLILDSDQRPKLLNFGLITVNRLGVWRPMCLNSSKKDATVATNICNILGFDEYIVFHRYPVPDRPVELLMEGFETNLKILGEKFKENNGSCDGLFVLCSNISIDSMVHNIYQKDILTEIQLYISPWNAVIYSDGKYICMGTILDKRWIVTSINCFRDIALLSEHYVVALMGKGKTNLSVEGPHEQIIQVVENINITNTDIMLLRLKSNITYDRYVKPAHFDLRRDSSRPEKCVAVGLENGLAQYVPLKSIKNCPIGSRCFEGIFKECSKKNPWSGTIVCDSRNGWYPAAVFHDDRGECGLSKTVKFTSIIYVKTKIQQAMTQAEFISRSPACDGFRCNLGECLHANQTCDGIPDCRGEEDETPVLCYEKENVCHLLDDCDCPADYMKCKNKKCIPKSSFCDRKNDCGDYEDEPDVCTCREYLKMAHPEKVCDGILNCKDRTDEDYMLCPCGDHNFKCLKSGHCVSHDVVCDGFEDCPNGEDETVCHSLEPLLHRANAGEVLTRTAGKWHSGCFVEDPTDEELTDLCKELNFKGENATKLPTPGNGVDLTAELPVIEQFHAVWIHRSIGNKLNLRMRTGNDPYVSFKPGKDCYRLFIECS